MTDISVIKMIISVAVWRIYPSWVNDKLRAWEGFGHSRKFWARLLRDDFRSKLEIISFLSRDMTFSKSFLFPALLKDLAPNVQALELLVSTMSWRSFWKLRSVTGHFFANSDYDHEYFLKIFFLFSKEPVLLSWQLWRSPGWAKHFGDGTSKTRMKTWSTSGVGEIERRRTIDRRRDWYDSCAVIHRPNRKKKKHNEASVWSCLSLNPSSSTNQGVLSSLFSRPDVTTVLHFAVIVHVNVQLLDGQAAARGKRRKAFIRDISGVDHWGVTNLSAPIWLTGQGHCTVFLSRDAIIFVGSLLEKHFDGDFTPDQEKEITFKRWPPGCQRWKLALALNGLNTTQKIGLSVKLFAPWLIRRGTWRQCYNGHKIGRR